MSAAGARQAKLNASRRAALSAALAGKTAASATSLSASYGLPLDEVQRAMRSAGVIDNAEHR